VTREQAQALNGGRAILILGVVVYHSARVFDTTPFYVKSSFQSEPLAWAALFGTIVGMPLFFCFAGFAIWHSFRARKTARLVRERLSRLLVPFVAGLVLLVPLQVYVARRFSGDEVSFLQSVQQFFDLHLTLQFPIPVTGPWFETAHLWFLGYLFGFTMLLLPVLILLDRRPRLPVLGPGGAAAVWLVALLAVAGAESLLGTEAAGGWNRWTYLAFLGLGVAIAIQPQMAKVVARGWRLSFICSLACFAGLAVTGTQLQEHTSVITSMDMSPVLWRFAKGLTIMLLLMAVVGSLTSRTQSAREPRSRLFARFVSYVQPISLPVYVVHQTVLVILAFWIVQWPIPGPVQFLALALLTIGLSIATVELVASNSAGRVLLGLPPRQREQLRAQDAAAGPAPARAMRPAGREPDRALNAAG
jgi:peptidoglycan/LPS O-acetylase OafA/YrhL